MANLGFGQFQYPMQSNMNFGQNRQLPFYNNFYTPNQDEEEQYAPQASQTPQAPQANMGGNAPQMGNVMFGSIPIQRDPRLEQYVQQIRQQMMAPNNNPNILSYFNRGYNNLAPNGIRNSLYTMFNRG